MEDSDDSVHFSELIPEMREMRCGGAAIDIHDWLAARGSYDLAIAFGQLFWPRFVLFRDCVFWRAIDPAIFEKWLRQVNSEKRAVEAMLNHVHVLDLFPNSADKATRQQLVHVGKLLQEMWSCKLAHDFPQRTFDVMFTEGDPADLVAIEVTFSQRAT